MILLLIVCLRHVCNSLFPGRFYAEWHGKQKMDDLQAVIPSPIPRAALSGSKAFSFAYDTLKDRMPVSRFRRESAAWQL